MFKVAAPKDDYSFATWTGWFRFVVNQANWSSTTTSITVVYPDSDVTQPWQGQTLVYLYDKNGLLVDAAPTQTLGTRLPYQRNGVACVDAPS